MTAHKDLKVYLELPDRLVLLDNQDPQVQQALLEQQERSERLALLVSREPKGRQELLAQRAQREHLEQLAQLAQSDLLDCPVHKGPPVPPHLFHLLKPR